MKHFIAHLLTGQIASYQASVVNALLYETLQCASAPS